MSDSPEQQQPPISGQQPVHSRGAAPACEFPAGASAHARLEPVAVAGPRVTAGFVAALAFVAGLLSILFQGYRYGENNGVFYIPYVLRLNELPQFVNDPFYATLGDFASAFWAGLRVVATEGNVEALFLTAHVISRTLGVAAMLWWLGRLGVARRGLLVAAVLLAATPLFLGVSPVGRHGLFVAYLTHTELTTPLIVATLLLAQAGHIGRAFAVASLAYAINGFVGVWLVAALGLAWGWTYWPAYRHEAGAALKDLGRMAAGFLPIGLPTTLWLLSATQSAPATPFDYIAYLRSYYPQHFLIDAARTQSLAQLACMVGATLLVLRAGGFDAFWGRAYAGFAAIFAVGCALPWFTASPLLLNLHLLRVDGVMQLLSTVLVLAFVLRKLPPDGRLAGLENGPIATLATLASGQWMFVAASLLPQRLVLPPAVVAVLAGTGVAVAVVLGLGTSVDDLPAAWAAQPWLLGAIFLLAAARQPGRPGGHLTLLVLAAVGFLTILLARAPLPPLYPSLYQMALAVGVAAFVYLRTKAPLAWTGRLPIAGLVALAFLPVALGSGGLHLLKSHREDANRGDWSRLVTRVRQHPSPGQYLIPILQDSYREPDLQLEARVPVWVDWKRGAAVQWQPAYYDVWHGRFQKLRQLRTAQDFYRLACRESIPNLVVASAAPVEFPGAEPVYRGGRYQLFRLDLPCPEP